MLTEYFDSLLAIDDEEQLFAFVAAHPILTAKEAQPVLKAHVAGLLPAKRPDAGDRLAMLAEIGEFLRRSGEVGIGPGPIETLFARWKSGDVSRAHAEKAAGDARMGNSLSPHYVATLARQAERAAQSGEWQGAVGLCKLLLAALDARSDDLARDRMVDAATLSWLDIAARAVSDIPDGRIFHDARKRGEARLAAADARGDKALGAAFLHALGVLHLDPYMAGRTSSQFHVQIQTWLGRLEETYGNEIAFWEPENERTPPDPADGFDCAVRHLRAAAQRRTGESRGRSLKALAEALLWRGVAGGESAPDEVAATAKEALSLLAGSCDEPTVMTIYSMLSYVDSRAPEESLERARTLLETDLNDLVERTGLQETLVSLRQAASLCNQEGHHDEALSLFGKAASLAGTAAPEAERMTLALGQARALAALADAAVPTLDNVLERDGPEVAAELLQANAPAGSAERLAQLLVGLASKTSAHDMEANAIAIVERAVKLSPDFGEANFDMLLWLLGSLELGAAVNSLNAGACAEAIVFYMRALDRFVNADAPNHGADMLSRALDLLDPHKPETVSRFAVALAASGVGLEAIGGPAIREMIQRAWRTIMSAIMGQGAGKFNSELLLLMAQGAKGAGFAGVWNAHRRIIPDEDERRLLQRIGEARRTVLERGPTNASERTLIDENDILTSFLGEGESLGGDTPEQVLDNLQRDFDARIERRLRPRQRSLDDFLTYDEVRDCLDDRTVLLIQMFGEAGGGSIGLLSIAISRDNAFAAFGIGKLPSATISLTGADQSIELNWLALSVSAWREKLLEEPGPADLTPEGEAAIATAGEFLLGGDMDRFLADCRASGKDHLLVAPHGPLHFFPFHVLEIGGRRLAEDFAVTVLPNLCMLRKRRTADNSEPAHEDRRRFTALGLGFEDGKPHGLAPLPEAVEEARAIAEIFGVEPHLGAEATERRFKMALQGYRIAHLASHGRHHVAAPSFQAVYLTPADGDDGLLEAWELLDLELEGLALVGLSACETALGRFDVGDNLRGLPATLFLAGAESLVGTLWNVRSDAAQLFFCSFYCEIAAGADRRDAFANALRATRSAYPAYRDWAAFYLAGAWSAVGS